ncbi:GntR family transcriptional regulator [Pedobacter sp. NJ-S-72]
MLIYLLNKFPIFRETSTDTVLTILTITVAKMKHATPETHKHLYETIAANLTHQIHSNVLILGNKLPSIRATCQQYKVSMSTALQAYYLLESKSLIRSVPKSGYYVSYIPQTNALPNKSNPSLYLGNEDTSNIVSKVYDGISSDHIMLSLGVPATELLPLSKLNKAVSHAIHTLEEHGSGYEHVMGETKNSAGKLPVYQLHGMENLQKMIL